MAQGYARLKEMGLGHDEACQLLNIKSIKQDWIDKGQSIGDFIDAEAEALMKRGRQESTGVGSAKEFATPLFRFKGRADN